ncbi:DUF3899 domain-containing protein [Lentibacillus sp. L22]|uniref:DUF3899 domain-containing protein n=1 Tax=Lentibacillus TaxID=175304 RepID=UPI0022B13A41|nr:DUF3899 domain-containing protein [Lentibacillus daqui]
MLKKLAIWVGVSQILILLICFIIYKRIDLLAYINVAFVIGAILILLSMAGYVTKGRFFDIVFYSFQHIFSQMTDKDRRPLSELVPQNYLFPFISGIIAISLMLGALFWYM